MYNRILGISVIVEVKLSGIFSWICYLLKRKIPTEIKFEKSVRLVVNTLWTGDSDLCLCI